MKIVYGEESDFDGLSKSDVVAFSENEICEIKSYDDENPLDLTDNIGFDQWSKSFLRNLRHKFNEEGLPLSYIIRRKGSHCVFRTRVQLEQKCYLLSAINKNTIWFESHIDCCYRLIKSQ